LRTKFRLQVLSKEGMFVRKIGLLSANLEICPQKLFLGSNVTLHSPNIFKVADKANKPHIKANVNGEIKQFAPEEISAMVLGKMKEIAEAYLGHEVTHAVVTVSNFIQF